jgi:hypothetical protein
MQSTTFQTEARKTLTVMPVTPEQAADAGCPGATHVLIGRHATTYGTVRQPTGKSVRVPGWYSRTGVRTHFTPWNGQGETVPGWIGDPA